MVTDNRRFAWQALIAIFAILCTPKAAFASCEEFLIWSEEERRGFLTGWMTGTAMITSNQRLNLFSKRIQYAVDDRYPCTGSDCEIVTSAHFAIQQMRSNYRDGLLASIHRDDFYLAVNDYCESQYGPGSSLTEAIPGALGNMARSGKYSLLSFGVVLNGSERMAEMYSSRYVGGTLGGGRSIEKRSLGALCETKGGPVTLRGQKTISISVGDEISLDQIHLDAFDHDGNFVSGVPLRIREFDWLQNYGVIKSNYDDQRYVKISALTAGEIVWEAIPLCPQEAQSSATVRLIISEN